MPIANIPLADIDQLIERPIVYQIVDQIKEILDIPDNPKILFPGLRGAIQTPGSSTAEFDDVKEAKFNSDNLIKIEAIIAFGEQDIQSADVRSWDNPPVFLDKRINFSLRPAYLKKDVEIKFTLRNTSKTHVEQWLTGIRMKSAHGRDIYLCQISYQFPISNEFIILLGDIHELIEATDGYGESIGEYFQKNRGAYMTSLVNQAGNHPLITITQTQPQLVGQFDFVTTPSQPQHNQQSGYWETEFSFKFSYWQPDALTVSYPISVHNSYLPEIYLKNLERVVDYQKPSATMPYSLAVFQSFSQDDQSNQVRKPYPYIHIPSYDFLDSEFSNQTSTIATVLCFLDEDRQNLLDLSDLGDDYEIDADILDFFKTEYSFMHKLYHSVFHIEHYINDKKQDYSKIEITPNLMVRSLTPLSYRDRHHVRISLLCSMDDILYKALMRMANHPRSFVKVISVMNELFAIDPDFHNLGARDKIEPWMFTNIWRILTGIAPGHPLSSDTDLSNYVYGLVFTPSNKLNLLTGIDMETILKYLGLKNRHHYTTMNAAIIAKPRNQM